MNKKQWVVLAITFFLLTIFFINQDKTFQGLCGVPGTPPDRAVHVGALKQIPDGWYENASIPLTAPKQLTREEWIVKSSEPLTRGDLWCINTELYDPFIWLFGTLGWMFLILGFLEKKW